MLAIGTIFGTVMLMARILLLRPPVLYAKGAFSARVTPPLALAYLASALLQSGHQVEVFDALALGLDHRGEESYSKLANYWGLSTESILAMVPADVDALAVTAMFSQDWPHVEGIINALHDRFPHLPIIVGGEHASASPDYILTHCPAVTFVARGEGEETIVDFANWVAGTTSKESISGVSFLDADQQVIHNPARARILAVDSIARPAWEIFDMEKYLAVEGWGVERGRSMPILATRGCPYRCTFCSSPSMWTTRYVMRSPADVVDEIASYLTKFQASNIDFYDLTAVVKKSWILEFCAEVMSKGLKFTWQLPSGTRSEALDEEVIAAMVAAGCRNITYAPESGSARTLKVIKKKVVLSRLASSVKVAVRLGVAVKCNLIIGFPHESRRDVFATLKFAMKLAILGIDDAGIYLFSPYPGSELYADLRRKGVIPEMGTTYFESLLSYTDLRAKSTYCERVGTRELAFYRLTGMCVFYGLTYLRHPAKVKRSWVNIRNGRADSVFESRLSAILQRHRKSESPC